MALRITKTVLVMQEFIVEEVVQLPLPILQTEDGEIFDRYAVLIENEIQFKRLEIELNKETYISEHTTIKIEKI